MEECTHGRIAIAKTHLSRAQAKKRARPTTSRGASPLNAKKRDPQPVSMAGRSASVGKTECASTALGFLLSMLKPTIEDAVNRDTDKYFGKAEAKPKPKRKT
jgi:hypothetical protein